MIGGRDESKEVTFVIGFRHDDLFALEVRLVGQEEDQQCSNIAAELAEENAIENLDADANRGDDVEQADTSDGIYEIPRNEIKVLGKIDLSKFS